MSMKVSVVIPNWNGGSLLKANLQHVLKMGTDEVIIVDDASKDSSVSFLKTQKVKLLENKENMGFGKSVNRGVEAASGDIVILLNTDVKPLPGLLRSIIPHFSDENVFGVSLSEKGFSWGKGMWCNGYVEHEPGEITRNTHDTFWLSGGSSVIRKKIWDELGGFDEIFAPFYWEDIDISYRAAKRGYKLLWEPKARVIHKHEGTIGKYFNRKYINFIQERNQLLFIWKNITNKEMFREHIKNLCGRILRHPGYSKVVIAALSKANKVKRLRDKEVKEAKIDDKEIFSCFL